MRARGVIKSRSTNQVGIPALHTLHCRENHPGVAEIDASIAIQVIHPAIVIAVDEDVCRIAELMTAVASTPAFVAKLEVVLRSSKA